MPDIVEKLRKSAKNVRWTTEPPECAPTIEPDDAEEAADEIERLREENAKLRAAVSWLANLDMDRFTEHDEALLEAAIEEARAALGGDT